MRSKKQPKYTKNKDLIRIVKNYEIERNRPKGFKLLDKMICILPIGSYVNYSIYVSKNIHEECGFAAKYKGFDIWSIPVTKSRIYIAKTKSLYF